MLSKLGSAMGDVFDFEALLPPPGAGAGEEEGEEEGEEVANLLSAASEGARGGIGMGMGLGSNLCPPSAAVGALSG